MNLIKKILRWIGFVIFGSLLNWLTLAILTLAPIYAFSKLQDLTTFWFVLVGIIVIIIYYTLNDLISFFSFSAINKMKQDYWFSNTLLALISILFFYTLLTSFAKSMNGDFEVFKSFKGTILIITIVPSYLKLIYKSLIFPFTFENEEDSALLLII